jgi:uncharacterized BrkB/YihY/UPF0761 family membrane protein
MAHAKGRSRSLSTLRLLSLVLALTLLVFTVIGALVTLFSKNANEPALETRKNIPQVHQLERESLRRDGRNNGS